MSRVSKYSNPSAYKLPLSKRRNNNLSNNFNNDFKDLLFLSVINKWNNHGSYIHDGSSVTMHKLDLNFICPSCNNAILAAHKNMCVIGEAVALRSSAKRLSEKNSYNVQETLVRDYHF